MRATFTISGLVGLAIVALVTASAGAGMLVGSSYGVIYDIDPSTGVASNPRETGSGSACIGFGNGTLYGAGALRLYTINVMTGQTELRGNLQGFEEPQIVSDLAWDGTTNSLFALVHLGGTSRDDLYTIDPNTLVVTELGRLGHRYDTIGFDSAGTLFGVDPVNDVLGTIDKLTAATTSTVLLTSDIGLGAVMTFDEADALFLATQAGDDPSVLHALDSDTGVVTPIGSTGLDHSLWSLTYIPEPGTLMLLAAGAITVTRSRAIG